MTLNYLKLVQIKTISDQRSFGVLRLVAAFRPRPAFRRTAKALVKNEKR
jgi:hypothetical protein